MAESAPIKNVMISVVLFSLIIAGGVSLLGMVNNYNSNFFGAENITGFNNSFNKLNDADTEMTELKDSVTQDDESNFLSFGVLGAIFNIAWDGITGIFSSLQFLYDIIINLTTSFGIPTWFTLGASLLITIILLFGILALVFNRTV